MVGEGVEGNGLVAPGSTITSDLKPEETVNYELGTKWDVFHDRLSLTAAIFRTEKKNTRVLTDSFTYENAGESRVDGLELSASGKITAKWQVFAGYTYMQARQIDGGPLGKANDGNQLPLVASALSRIAVIGAGPSGLTAIKTLLEAGCDNLFAVETQGEVGGNWVFRDTTGHPYGYALAPE